MTTAPPVPRELIVCNEETRLDLSIPYDGNEDLYRDFGNWVDSGACGHADSDPARYPRHLRVAARPQKARDFAAIVQALDEVLHAAIETGNPVIWC